MDLVKLHRPGLPPSAFDALLRLFPPSHFARLLEEGLPFYRTTFWTDLGRAAENPFESFVDHLRPLAEPSAQVIGVEWWFSVLRTNATPHWLLPCHFDRSDLNERDPSQIRYPELSSVLFLNAVPYGELVVTDQTRRPQGIRPKQPQEMAFVTPEPNTYAVFSGNLYHGVIGRMWRPKVDPVLRISLAVNWWSERPRADYLRDSRTCWSAFRLAEAR
jgi:hypothetical protein